MIRTLFAILLFTVPLSSGATLVTVQSNLTIGGVYGPGVLARGQFDLAAQLGGPLANFQINSARVHFSWTDDSNDNGGASYLYAYPSGTQYGPWGAWYEYGGGFLDPDYRRDRIATHFITAFFRSETESARLNVSGVDFGSVDSVYTGDVFLYGETEKENFDDIESVETRCNLWFIVCLDEDTYTSVNLNYREYLYYSQNYGGTFSRDIDLITASLLGELLQTGRLSFSFAMNGDAFLSGAFLEVDVTPLAPPPPPHGVPEPFTLALLGVGLAGMTFARRKRIR